MKTKIFNLIAMSVLLIQSASAITLEDVYRDTIINDVILAVPSEYADIEEALLFLDDKRIARDVTVTIQVADGTYNDYPTIVLDHPYGGRIQIIGNTSAPGNVVLNFTSASGIYADKGHSIGKIDGFTLVGNQTDHCDGIRAGDNASLVLGSHMVIQNFDTGIFLRRNGTIYAPGITIQNCKSHGIDCGVAIIIAEGAVIENNGGWGLSLFRSGYIEIVSSTISNNTLGSVWAGPLSCVKVLGATISGTTAIHSTAYLWQ